MASVFKRTDAKPIPAGAVIATVRGQKVAKFTDGRGRRQSYPLSDDGAAMLVERRNWYIAYVDADGRRKVAKGYVDKEATESLARKLEVQAARKKEGLYSVDPDKLKAAIAGVVDLYCDDLAAAGRDDKYVANCRGRLKKLAEACGWTTPTAIRLDALTAWRTTQADKKAPRTLNQYIETLGAFVGWCVDHRYMGGNPIERIAKADASDKRRKRRGLDLDQLRKLLTVAGDRWLVYLAAMKTGLRRDELGKLQWGDVHLTAAAPHIRFRGTANKARREDTVPLEAEVAEALTAARPADAKSSDAVFPAGVPEMDQYRADLAAAGIAYKDDQGRQADFHALRVSYNMLLARAGVPVRVAMQLMRHTDIKLTTVNYTDPGLLDMGAAVDKLPRLTAAEKV